jgi:hypothetical protein
VGGALGLFKSTNTTATAVAVPMIARLADTTTEIKTAVEVGKGLSTATSVALSSTPRSLGRK